MTPTLNMPVRFRRMASDYFLSPKLKKHFSGTRFSSEEDVKTAAENWLNGQGRDFCQAALHSDILRLDSKFEIVVRQKERHLNRQPPTFGKIGSRTCNLRIPKQVSLWPYGRVQASGSENHRFNTRFLWKTCRVYWSGVGKYFEGLSIFPSVWRGSLERECMLRCHPCYLTTVQNSKVRLQKALI
ncbi:hypothetical protein AVEN_124663-1 [Araneus ventricosus]|uniref:Uncharacterized protein n=1 Tax=Araneus ventricosus TaxID=182803 RepID=A0A4Y2KHN1_ARAVE|nr:hypothetical protein AVEN_124663-1 [Araneus ventricosus]